MMIRPSLAASLIERKIVSITVAISIADYHGYGATDYYAVDEHLGTLELLQRLVDQAHAIGLKVIQDQVANHIGPAHPWVLDPPKPTWFHGIVEHHVNETWQIDGTSKSLLEGIPNLIIKNASGIVHLPAYSAGIFRG